MTIPKEQAEADIAVFAEYISRLNPDPHCRVGGCFGRGYLGFQVVPTKDGPRVQLLTCKCSRIGETEYSRLTQRFDTDRVWLLRLVEMESEKTRARTFFGAFEYLWKKIRK